MKRLFVGALITALGFVGCSGSKTETGGVPSITPAETAQILGRDTSVVVLDVRTWKEFGSETGHLQGAIHIPVDSLNVRLAELDPYKSKTFITYCRSGVRSARAQKFLADKGFRVLSMVGGILRWNNERYPVVKEGQ